MFCQSCGHDMPDGVKYCQRCGAPMDDPPEASVIAVAAPNAMPPPFIHNPTNSNTDAAQTAQESTDQTRAKAAMSRYKDAYFVSRSITGIGTLVKVIGVLVGVVLFLIQAATTSYLLRSEAAIVMSLITSFIAGLIIYIVGVIVSAQGQMLKASLDSAVHSSPFLDDEQRARAMSLS